MWATIDVRRPAVLLVGALAALAWLAMWLWGQSPYGRFLDHEGLDEATGGPLLVVFVGGWTLMTVAMMLPTSLPLVSLFARLTQGRPDHSQLMGLLVLGYLGTWALFGLGAHIADLVLHEAVRRSAWLEAHTWLFGAGILMVTGLYQFTPLKYQCLDKCRSPFSFIAEHWRGAGQQAQAFRLGVHHGLFCVGCCWPLMLLMFAVGVGSLGWMLALGAVMAVEKNMPWGRRLSAPLGALLLACGLGLAAWHASGGTGRLFGA